MCDQQMSHGGGRGRYLPRPPRVLLALLLLSLLSACAGSSPNGRATSTAATTTPLPTPNVTGTPAPRISYVAIGASDAYGVGTTQPARDNWPAVLAASLGPAVHLTNLGIPGATVALAVRDELPVALHLQPDLVTVLLGINDLDDGVSGAAFDAQIHELLATLHGQTTARVFIGNLPDLALLPHFATRDPVALHAQVLTWNHDIARAAAAEGATVVDLFDDWGELAQHPEFVSADGLHPSTLGAARLAAVFATAIAAAIA